MRMVESEPLHELPWMRRERADANIRYAVGELRALALEDPVFTRHYLLMAELFSKCLQLLNEIEDFEAKVPS